MLDNAVNAATTKGVKCRVLFLINPHNPTGVIHSREELITCMKWAKSNDMHVVVDEIYANSVWNESAETPFQSVVEICNTSDTPFDDSIHVLWGLSKDFGMSGYRTGVLYTKNAALLTALSNVNYFTTVSNDTQDCLAALLNDEEFIEEYLRESRRALRASYEKLVTHLEAMSISYVPASAGMFVWIDLRHLLLPNPEDALDAFACERELTRVLFEECRLLFTPGEPQRAQEPGYYRICFAYVPLESIDKAFERLSVFISSRLLRSTSN